MKTVFTDIKFEVIDSRGSPLIEYHCSVVSDCLQITGMNTVNSVSMVKSGVGLTQLWTAFV